MSKKLHIPDDKPDSIFVLGIASDERIWKLSWEINNLLGINLTFRELDSNEDRGEKKKSADTSSLISVDAPQVLYSAHYYEDNSTHSELDFIFFRKEKQYLPKSVQGFSFFLFIRSANESVSIEKYIKKLQASSLMRSVIDLSFVEK